MVIHQKRISRFFRSSAGMTIPEILVVIMIVALLMGGFQTVLTAGFESWQANSVRNSQQLQLFKSVAWINSDLIQSGAAVINLANKDQWYSSVCFKKATGVTGGSIDWSGNICYQLNGTNLERNSIPVAINIDVLQFRQQTAAPDVIEVNLRAHNTEFTNKWGDLQSALSFKVRMRN